MPNIPVEFYEEEERCGYVVSAEMKKIWAIELDLLQKFSSVCEKHGLSYFIDGGTLLGAVRHGGFIPWDDDADVCMPREDYDRLAQIAEKEFEDPYFYQSTLTETGFFRTHAQLRNSNTTGCIDIDCSKDINRGIFIDIFPIDAVADNKLLRYMQKKRISALKRLLAFEYDRDYNKQGLAGRVFYKFTHAFFNVIPYKKVFSYFDQHCLARYRRKRTRLVGDISLKWRTNVHWKREWFEGYVYLPFETLMLRAPAFYTDVLRRQYGDFMRIPKNIVAPNGRCHGAVTFSPDIPYKDYFKKPDIIKVN